MTRRPSSREMCDLLKLAKAKELSAQGEVTRLTARLRFLEDQRTALETQRFDATTPEQAQALEKWYLWRKGEIRSLSTQAAVLAAERQVAMETCAQLVAEHEVIQRLTNHAIAEERREAERRRSYIS